MASASIPVVVTASEASAILESAGPVVSAQQAVALGIAPSGAAASDLEGGLGGGSAAAGVASGDAAAGAAPDAAAGANAEDPYYWETADPNVPITVVLGHTAHWMGARFIAGIEYLGEVFATFMGMTNSRYDWAIEAAREQEVRGRRCRAASRRTLDVPNFALLRRIKADTMHRRRIQVGGGCSRRVIHRSRRHLSCARFTAEHNNSQQWPQRSGLEMSSRRLAPESPSGPSCC